MSRALLCALLPALFLIVSPGWAAPTATQLTELARVARAERAAASLSPPQRRLLRQLVRHVKKGGRKAAGKAYCKLRSHPRHEALLDHALFHGIVLRKPRVAKLARKERFYGDQRIRLAVQRKLLRQKKATVGTGKATVSMVTAAPYIPGGAVVSIVGTRRLDDAQLRDAIRDLETQLEHARNERQRARQSFAATGSNMLQKMLSRVLKDMAAMRTALTHHNCL